MIKKTFNKPRFFSDSGNSRSVTVFLAAAVLLTLAAAGFYIFSVRAPVEDLIIESLEFETELSGLLAGSGIPEDSISSSRRSERKDNVIWVKFFREIETSPRRAEKLTEELKEVARRRGYEVYLTRYPGKSELTVSYGGALFSRIIFDLSKRARAAIIVDDLGYSEDIESFTSLGVPLTYAVMPGLPYSRRIAEELKQDGLSYILHMPMEPEGYPDINPGSPALFRGMSIEEVEKALEKALSYVPGAPGLNNHMGSAFTSDRVSVKALMEVLGNKDMFFIDSWTTGSSLALETARELEVPSARNRVFLDNEDSPEYIRSRLTLLKERALEHEGIVIGICHINRKHTADIIREFLPVFQEAGVELVLAAEALR